KRKYCELDRIGGDGQQHGRLELRTGRDGYGVICHTVPILILDETARPRLLERIRWDAKNGAVLGRPFSLLRGGRYNLILAERRLYRLTRRDGGRAIWHCYPTRTSSVLHLSSARRAPRRRTFPPAD